jgi:hypothetical protein
MGPDRAFDLLRKLPDYTYLKWDAALIYCLVAYFASTGANIVAPG